MTRGTQPLPPGHCHCFDCRSDRQSQLLTKILEAKQSRAGRGATLTDCPRERTRRPAQGHRRYLCPCPCVLGILMRASIIWERDGSSEAPSVFAPPPRKLGKHFSIPGLCFWLWPGDPTGSRPRFTHGAFVDISTNLSLVPCCLLLPGASQAREWQGVVSVN